MLVGVHTRFGSLDRQATHAVGDCRSGHGAAVGAVRRGHAVRGWRSAVALRNCAWSLGIGRWDAGVRRVLRPGRCGRGPGFPPRPNGGSAWCRACRRRPRPRRSSRSVSPSSAPPSLVHKRPTAGRDRVPSLTLTWTAPWTRTLDPQAGSGTLRRTWSTRTRHTRRWRWAPTPTRPTSPTRSGAWVWCGRGCTGTK